MHSVATCTNATLRTEHQLNSQPTAQKLVTTQLQLLRLISKTSLLCYCWQPDVTQQASARAGSDVDEELSKYLSDQSTECYGTELLSTHQETVH